MGSHYLSLPNALLDEAGVMILPVPYESTVTYRPGTSTAPSAILAASDQLELYEEDMRWNPSAHMGLTVLPAFESAALESEADYHARLQRQAASLPVDPLLIALGGEHSITPSLVAGRMPQPGVIVHIDAHADLRPSYLGSIYNHACPAYRLRQAGHRLIQIGVRSLCEEEAALIAADDGINTWFDRDLARPGVWSTLLDQLRGISGQVWLTMDMDGLDPALAPGVGTPQPGGLNWHQILDILQAVLANAALDVRGLDIVELVPEPSRVSDMTAAKLVQKSMSYWGKARDFDKRLTR
ncbi:MAG: agmatinase [Mariprofundaceae bacterium]